jgi:catechol 2,3-dioxygenase-like lactoylglutathione lyase family enzyme
MIENILGVDHVGLSVRDMEAMKTFYRNVLGFNGVFAEMPEDDHQAMHEFLRNGRTVHSAITLTRETGSLSVALFHTTYPVPRPIRKDFRYGDIGVSKITFGVPDVRDFWEKHAEAARLCSFPKTASVGDQRDYQFVYGRDPEGNLIEFTSEDNTLGFLSIGIAVTDLERSLLFYRNILGFDKTVIAPHESFSGLVDEVSGESGTQVRSSLIANSKGKGMLEIFEVMKPRGRSIPFDAQWGDFGYLQVCLYGTDNKALSAQIETEHLDITLPLQLVDDPEYPASFMYLRDPDGIPVEIVFFGERIG